MIRKDKTGEIVNGFTILSFSHRSSEGRAIWNAECPHCSRVIQSAINNLKKNKSCGCKRAELNGIAHKKHGMKGTLPWRTWQSMKGRCLVKSNTAYPNYGAKGITICPEWIDSFEAFYEYMGDPPEGKPTLDRIDNSKGYFPGNVRWASWKEQIANRSISIKKEE